MQTLLNLYPQFVFLLLSSSNIRAHHSFLDEIKVMRGEEQKENCQFRFRVESGYSARRSDGLSDPLFGV